jgi:ergothioneine biosynthesis protein EgtB
MGGSALMDAPSYTAKDKEERMGPLADPRSPAARPAAGDGGRYLAIRRVTQALARPLSAEDCVVQSMPDASPVKWHLAHTTWFFETFVLAPHVAGYQPLHAAYRSLFNSYYDAVGERHPRPQRGLLSRPSLEEVLAYRRHVDDAMLALLDSPSPALTSLIELGLQHEQQHQELILTDVKHLLSCNPLEPVYQKQWPLTPIQPRERRWIAFDGGVREIGHGGEGFCFDNETPRHRAYAAPFEIASRPATYGDFLAFIDDGGYARPELWLSMGWDWVRGAGRTVPLYWQRDGDRWFSHTLQGRVEIDPHTPVCHLSYFEADAFARWSGARLPSELEWELAARVLRAPASLGNFADRGAFHPLPQKDPVGDEPVQMFGDVWEWTQSAYLPYPGYRPLPGAVGEYNGKFMCNQFVLRGGSCATPAGHVRASYRNFFPPDAQWQFSGVRLARDA